MNQNEHKHAARRRPGAVLIAATLAVVVMGVAIAALLRPDTSSGSEEDTSDDATPAAGGGDCTPLSVVVAASYRPVLEAAEKSLAEGDDCVTVKATTADGRAAYAEVETQKAQAWIPDDAAWGALALDNNAEAAEHYAEEYPEGEEGESEEHAAEEEEEYRLATSPIVFVARPATAEKLNAAGGNWSALAKLVEAAGRVRLVTQPPGDSADGLLGLGGLGDVVWDESGMDPSAEVLYTAHENSRVADDPLSGLQEGEIALVSERTTITEGTEGLEVIVPDDGTTMLRYPLVETRFGSAKVEKAMHRLLEDLQDTKSLAGALTKAGLRGPDGKPASDGFPGPAELPTARAVLDPHRSEHVFATWYREDRRANVIIAVDVSGSMAEKLPGSGTSRMAVVRDQTIKLESELPDTAGLGLWIFGSRLDGGRDHIAVAPFAPLDAAHRRAVRDAAQQDLYSRSTGTGLHDTIVAAYQEGIKRYQDDVPTQILVLTDGKNQDDPGGMTSQQMSAKLGQLAKEDRPIGLSVVKVGPADEALAAALEPAGGHLTTAQDTRGVVAAFVHFAAGGLH